MRLPATALLGLALLGRPLLAQQDHDMGAAPSRTSIRGFTDVSYLTGGRAADRRPGFQLGQFDLFVTSLLARDVSFTGETVFEFDRELGEFAIDIERVIVTYSMNEHLRLSGGKMHTPIGYWNNAYHHGTALQPTIERPMVVQFEDNGGPLPVHTTGVQLSGRDLGDLHLGFDVLVGNGLGNHPSADTNTTPSVTLALHSQLTPALRVGVSAYHDRVVAGTHTLRGDALGMAMTQTIGGGFVSYFDERFEAVVEGQRIANRAEGLTTSSPGWFAYGGVRLAPRLVPYVMHDELRLAEGDPYYAGAGITRETLGLRFEKTAAVVLKLEARSTDRRGPGRATDAGVQVAVAF